MSLTNLFLKSFISKSNDSLLQQLTAWAHLWRRWWRQRTRAVNSVTSWWRSQQRATDRRNWRVGNIYNLSTCWRRASVATAARPVAHTDNAYCSYDYKSIQVQSSLVTAAQPDFYLKGSYGVLSPISFAPSFPRPSFVFPSLLFAAKWSLKSSQGFGESCQLTSAEENDILQPPCRHVPCMALTTRVVP